MEANNNKIEYNYNSMVTTLWQWMLASGYAPPIMPPSLRVVTNSGEFRNGKLQPKILKDGLTLAAICYGYDNHNDISINFFNPYSIELCIYHDNFIVFLRDEFKLDVSQRIFEILLSHVVLHEFNHYIALYDHWRLSHDDTDDEDLDYDTAYYKGYSFFSKDSQTVEHEADNEYRTLQMLREYWYCGPSHPEYKKYYKDDKEQYKKYDPDTALPDRLIPKSGGQYVKYVTKKRDDTLLAETTATIEYLEAVYNAEFCTYDMTLREIDENKAKIANLKRTIRRFGLDSDTVLVIDPDTEYSRIEDNLNRGHVTIDLDQLEIRKKKKESQTK